jgi:hypothetical protein
MSRAGEDDPPAGPTTDDVGAAHDLLARPGHRPPSDAYLRLVAQAVSAVRRSQEVPDAVGAGELRASHDVLWATGLRHQVPALMGSLADALLSRGVVPAQEEYGGEWWLWWPQEGRGPCQHCGTIRALRRYSAQFGNPYRYLCRGCRDQENTEQTEYLNAVTGVIPQPGEDPESLLTRRLAATAAQKAEALQPPRPGRRAPVPWDSLIAHLVTLLGPLAQAGWELPGEYDCDADPHTGPLLTGEVERTGMVIVFEYEPTPGELRLLPFADIAGDQPESLSMLDDPVAITVGPSPGQGAEKVRDHAGELGLLDATRVRAGDNSDVSTDELLAERYREWIFEPARDYRQIPMKNLISSLDADEAFSVYFRVVVGWLGSGVLPDLLPDTAALGVAAWCWRNNTAVEDWHLPSDILMARVNIAVTKAIRPHVDHLEGIDWQGLESALTDRAWALPGGRVISELFGEGWPDVERTVRKQVRSWRRIEEELVGPEATLRLLTVGGSTSYTRRWWGQGRWPAICRQVVTEAQQAGVPLPSPYDQHGSTALLHDLASPDLLSDDVLGWLIDMPSTNTGGPDGLRHHHTATRPLIREFTLKLETD